jgi:hypothetical protein
MRHLHKNLRYCYNITFLDSPIKQDTNSMCNLEMDLIIYLKKVFTINKKILNHIKIDVFEWYNSCLWI